MEILTTSITFKIPEHQKSFFKAQAKKERRTMSSVIRNVLEDYCQREQAKSKPSSKA